MCNYCNTIQRCSHCGKTLTKRMFLSLEDVVPNVPINYSNATKEDIYNFIRKLYFRRADQSVEYPNYTIDWFLDGMYLFQDIKKTIVDPPYKNNFVYQVLEHYTNLVNDYWDSKYPERCYPLNDPRHPKNPHYKKAEK